MQKILIFVTLLGLSLAVAQGEEDDSKVMEAPEYKTLTQDKIVELYEFLKAELEGEDEEIVAPTDETLRNKRSASPFFLRRLFRWKRRNFGFGRRNYY